MRPWRFHGHYQRGVMNKTELKYADHLELLKRAGEIEDYKYERIKFKLADKTYYSPDFLVIFKDRFEMHEVKGFWEDDARVKIKVAAEQNPWFKFVAIKWKNNREGWIKEEFGS